MKINLILSRNNWTSFHQTAFTNTIADYFNIVYIEDGNIPTKDNSLLVSNLTKDRWYTDLYHQGYSLVVDLLWGGWSFDLPDAFILTTPNWFWYNESLLYQTRGYQNYQPNRKYIKKSLMPMGLIKESHDMLYNRVSEYLDDFIWSYIQRVGKSLPNDAPHNLPGITEQDQRYFNPEWYDHTYFSLVSETTVDNNFPLHITEKSFKPIAFQHPYMIWGQTGLLNHLHSLGFESYENLFDESYDIEPNNIRRVEMIVANINKLKYVEYDELTNKKIQHNHQLFFNFDIINARIKQEIVNPIIEFFENSRHS